jgi:hypothetical protein
MIQNPLYVYDPITNTAKLALPDVEIVSAKVHEAWVRSKLCQGVTTRKSEAGEELMVPYEQLSEAAKDLDRGTVRAVYAAIEQA